ncbi:MAG: serine/threonine-protein kinase [Pseudomonadota bacterium]
MKYFILIVFCLFLAPLSIWASIILAILGACIISGIEAEQNSERVIYNNSEGTPMIGNDYIISDEMLINGFPDKIERGFVTLDPDTIASIIASNESAESKNITEELKEANLAFHVYKNDVSGNNVIVNEQVKLSCDEIAEIAQNKISSRKTYDFAGNIRGKHPRDLDEYILNYLEAYGFLYPRYFDKFMELLQADGHYWSPAEIIQKIEKTIKEAGPLNDAYCMKKYYFNLICRHGDFMLYNSGLLMIHNMRHPERMVDLVASGEFLQKDIKIKLEDLFIDGKIAFITSADNETMLGIAYLKKRVLKVAIPESKETKISNIPEGCTKLLADKYQLLSEIARGGMGQVFEGYNIKRKHKVAIKKLKEELKIYRRERERFIKEAKIISRLKHPDIVKLYEIIEEDYNIYLVFELLKGQNIEDMINKMSKFPLLQALKIACDVSMALAYAHKFGIIHRDLKPSNIFFCDDGKIKVMDFGIAREVKDSVSRLTGNNDTSGTMQYMSPEQILGARDIRGDIYALGVTLYEMITGKVPFRGGDVYIQKKEMAYIKASEIDSSIPKEVDIIIEKCLQADPEKRYSSCLELFRALRTLHNMLDIN